MEAAYYRSYSPEDIFRSCEYNGQGYLYGKRGYECHGESKLRFHIVHVHDAIEDDKRNQKEWLDANQDQKNLTDQSNKLGPQGGLRT
jgi:hypothetical protein